VGSAGMTVGVEDQVVGKGTVVPGVVIQALDYVVALVGRPAEVGHLVARAEA
jgi:hypothetical protein